MKFVLNRDILLKEISIAQEIIATTKHFSNPILANVFIHAENNKLTIKATDIKVNFETCIPADVLEEGYTTVYCDKFYTLLNTFPQCDVEFTNDESKVTLIPLVRKGKHTINTFFSIPSESKSKEYPDFSTPSESTKFFSFSIKDFKDMLSQTIFAISDDETRHFMTGVYFEKDGDKFVMVTTDGRRLAYASKPFSQNVDDFTPVIVPPKLLNILLKHAPNEGDIEIANDEKNDEKMIYFKFGNYQFASSLIVGNFPNYHKVIPENQNFFFEVQKSELLEITKIVEAHIEDKAKRIIFSLDANALTVLSQESDGDSGQEEISCVYEGEKISIGLSYQYIDETLKAIPTDRIRFEFSGNMKAITIKPCPESDYFHIVMPMQID
ncbi:MAG: DNA polymerase III subunit beta [Termitinemataceae bacterium]|nr:MAG: DNA polymerase III subunit beta [Termitinemataceae bacterium]